jgi:hypothetical protein
VKVLQEQAETVLNQVQQLAVQQQAEQAEITSV